jgi:GntR family transcriptional regulator
MDNYSPVVQYDSATPWYVSKKPGSGDRTVTNINLDLTSKVPIYIQIRDQLRLMIATGEMEAGDQMPPVRDLASELLINPNTVQKAYHDLEREGFIHTRRGMGTFVTDRPRTRSQGREKAHAEELARDFVTRLFDLGLDADEVRTLVQETLRALKPG